MPAARIIPTLIAQPDRVQRYAIAKERRRVAAQRSLRAYYNDPVLFAHDCFDWEDGQGITEYQEEILSAIVEKKKVSVRSLHGAGKTMTVAIAILWFSLTRDAAGVDWKCPTTAGAWRQLEQYLWPEVHKWAALIKWGMLGREAFTRQELLRQNLNLAHGSAFAVASDVPAYIEGVHANSVFYVFDESKVISAATFDAAEGAFSGAGIGGNEAFGLSTSTPGEPTGRFYEIQTQKPGYEDWTPIHVSLPRAINAGRVNPEWVEQKKLQWGEDSALFANRVLGEFHSADEDGVIPLSWVEAAVERWKISQKQGPLQIVGADIARSGDDNTVLALRYGNRIEELRMTHHEDTMQTTGRIGGILEANHGAVAVVDTDGLGAGVTDRLRELGHPAQAFHAGAKTDKRDRSKELGFVNVRAAAWWGFREALDPTYDSTIELPDDAELLGDLTAPHWKIDSSSRILIEAKVDIKKRIGRSTDAADAVVMAFWEDRKKRKRRMGNISDVGERLPTGPEYATAAA